MRMEEALRQAEKGGPTAEMTGTGRCRLQQQSQAPSPDPLCCPARPCPAQALPAPQQTPLSLATVLCVLWGRQGLQAGRALWGYIPWLL